MRQGKRLLRVVPMLALLAVPALAMLSVPTFATAATGMQPGLWELALTVTIEGKVQTIPAARACISQKDIDDPTKTLPRPDGDCKLTNVGRTVERATYDLACTQNLLTTRGRAEIVFEGDRYHGTVDMKVTDDKGAAVIVAMTINARHAGDCSR